MSNDDFQIDRPIYEIKFPLGLAYTRFGLPIHLSEKSSSHENGGRPSARPEPFELSCIFASNANLLLSQIHK